ncbi:hypothetical protein BJF85_03675 [Saccharomonospora sp. CUA-673]|nr:hypothetical protein BJF85_03675 [Saccharomonospora sp. CUA-673]
MLVAGCGQAVGGDPRGDAAQGDTAEGGTAQDDTRPTRSAPPSSAPSAEPLDPCAWLDPADRSTAGLSVAGEPRDVAGAPACDYTEPGVGGVTITVDDASGVADLEAGADDVERLRIGARDAVRMADRAADDGTCAVVLATGPGSSVHIDVSSVDFTDTASSCERATTVAELVEPELPRRAE